MLELIFQGFLEWAYGLVLECWEYFSGTLLNILHMDFSYLKTHVPVVDSIMQIMLAVGWALLLGNLVFQALKSMTSGLGFEAEDPKLLFTRTFVFAFLLLASPQICELILGMTQTVIDILQIPDAVEITFADESIFGGIGASWILIIIVGIVIMFKVFGLISEIAERYVILAMLTICAPLAFGVGGSRNTSDIFTGWCRMFASMCFMMVSNIIFFKMLLSVLSFVPTGLDVLPWIVLVLTITKVAKKVDAIITRIGLNPAITGDSLGGRSLPGMLTYTLLRSATKQVVQTAGKNAEGGTRGTSPKTPPGGGSGGGPKSGSPAGGGHYGTGVQRGGQSARTQNTAYQTNSTSSAQQSSAAPSSGGQNAAAFSSPAQSHSAQQESAQQATPWAPEHPGVTRPGMGGREKANAGFGGQSPRQSAVPPGMRRAASHIRQQDSGMAGTAGSPGMDQPGRKPSTPIGMAGIAGTLNANRPGQKADAPSGTAGMAAASMRAQPGGQAQRPGAAAQAAGRFTQTVQNAAREGDMSTSQHASQSQNISVAGPMQGRQRDSGAAGTRHTQHIPTTPKNATGDVAGTPPSAPPSPSPVGPNGTAGTRMAQSGIPTPGAMRPNGAYSEAEPPSRPGRNAAPAAPTAPSSHPEAVPGKRTARQEPPAGMAGAASKAYGTAGMRGSVPGDRKQSPPSAQASERPQSTFRPPIKMDGKKMSTAATVQQEKAQPSDRQSNRKKPGGDDHGK